MKKRIEAKYVIVGLGILGSTLLKELLERGEKDIVVLEMEKNFGGASAHSFGMLRVFHDSDKLREIALKSFQHIQQSPEKSLAEKRPFLSIRPLNNKLLEQIKALEKTKFNFEVLSVEQIYQRYNILASSDAVGILEPDALTFNPHKLLDVYHKSTLPNVQVVRDEATHLIENDRCIDVVCKNGNSLRANFVFIASGSGSIPLLAGRCINLKPKIIEYQSSSQSYDHLPQLLHSKTHEFISQREGKTYYRFLANNQLKKQLNLVSENTQQIVDISSEVSQESFGRIPGSKRIYFMGAWNGNAFKLSWHLAKSICDCVLAKQSTYSTSKRGNHEINKIL